MKSLWVGSLVFAVFAGGYVGCVLYLLGHEVSAVVLALLVLVPVSLVLDRWVQKGTEA